MPNPAGERCACREHFPRGADVGIRDPVRQAVLTDGHLAISGERKTEPKRKAEVRKVEIQEAPNAAKTAA